MEDLGHAGFVLELVVNGVFISLEGIQPPIRTPARKSSPRSASQFSCTVPDLPGTRSNKRAVGCSSPRVRSTMPVNSRGPGGVGPGDATRLSSTPSTRAPPPQKGQGH